MFELRSSPPPTFKGAPVTWANPELELAFAYAPNLCSLGHFDPREAALSRAVIACATRSRAWE